MNIVISCTIGLVIGFVVGFLVFRNNADKIKDAEKKVVDIAGKFKDGEK